MLKCNRVRNLLILLGLSGILGWALAQEDVTSSAPPLEKDAAIAQIEERKGSVGIDGDAPGQPVWMVDFSLSTSRHGRCTPLRGARSLQNLSTIISSQVTATMTSGCITTRWPL
jgi:hypothetical protein